MVQKEAEERKDGLIQKDIAINPEKGKELVETDKPINTSEKTKEPIQTKDQKDLSLVDSIKLARENSKQRKFEQTWDLLINLKGIDLKKPENRFSAEMTLPKGRGKEPKVAVFADLMEADAKKNADLVIPKKDISALAGNKRKAKRIANDYDFFFGEAPLMPEIGKSLGTVLGPRGKVPKPMPPKGNIAPMLNASKRMVRVVLKETPVVSVIIGSEKMDDADIAENAQAVYTFVKEKLPKGKNNIKSSMVKLTMGKPIKVTIR